METDKDQPTLKRRASDAALAFASLIRTRRKAMKLRQDELALATGVGRRFLIELEAGKSSCQLGRSLIVAEGVGLRLLDILGAGASPTGNASDIPELPAEVDGPA